jgi:hypothetical protein
MYRASVPTAGRRHAFGAATQDPFEAAPQQRVSADEQEDGDQPQESRVRRSEMVAVRYGRCTWQDRSPGGTRDWVVDSSADITAIVSERRPPPLILQQGAAGGMLHLERGCADQLRRFRILLAMQCFT